MIKRVQGVCLLSSFRGGAKNRKRKYNRQVMLTAPRTLITPTYCQTDIQRQGKACSVGIRVWILSLFNPWRTASPELEQSWYWTAREKKRNEKKMLFARPANSMLLQHSAWGHAASAAPSALERRQRGRSSWESNTSRIQSSHGCSRLWVHVNSLPRSYFLFTGTYFVKLFFFFFHVSSTLLS